MRVGIDGRMLYHSGIGRYIQNILLTLPSSELRMVVWLNEKGMKDKRLDSPYLEKRLIRSHLFSPFEQLELAWKASREKLDLFHAPHVNAPLLFPGRLVVTVHDLIPILFPGTIAFALGERYFSAMVRLSSRRAAKVLTVSENTKKDLVDFGVPPEKIEAVLNGVDPLYGDKLAEGEKVAALGRYGIKAPYLLYAGQWKRYKNVLGLLEAFALVKGNFPELSLVLVGKEDRREKIFEAIERLGLGGSVVITGYVAEERDVVAIYQGAEIFVFPSHYEGFGLPPLEAMMAGVPVVSSNRSAMPEVLGEAALLVEPDDASLAQGVWKVLEEPELRRELIEKGRIHSALLNWGATARGVMKAYEEAVSR